MRVGLGGLWCGAVLAYEQYLGVYCGEDDLMDLSLRVNSAVSSSGRQRRSVASHSLLLKSEHLNFF